MGIFILMSGKRIVFSTPTPNDQGLIIPNESMDFARFKSNPVILCQHNWEAPPLGIWEDWKIENGQWTAIPVFHKLTYESYMYSDLWEAGQLVACSIGGEAEWLTNGAGQPKLTKEGYKTAERFNLYEISMVTLPSNPDATVKLSALIYAKEDLDKVNRSIVTLSSKYKIPPTMEKSKEEIELEAAQANVTRLTGLIAAAGPKVKAGANGSDDPSHDQLPSVIKDILNNNTQMTTGFLGMFEKFFTALTGGKKEDKLAGAPAPKGLPTSTLSDGTVAQPTPTGLSAAVTAAKLKAEKALNAAHEATKVATAARLKAVEATATKEEKDAYTTALSAAQVAFATALEAEEEYKACMDSEDEGGEDMKAKDKAKTAAAPTKVTLGTTVTPTAGTGTDPAKPITMKSADELGAEGVKLAPKPEIVARVKKEGRVSFSALSNPKNEEGARIIGRSLGSDSQDKDIADYAILLESIMTDGKFKAIVDKTRVIANISEAQFNGFKKSGDLNNRPGLSLAHFAAELQSGCVTVMGRDNQMHRVTSLSAKETVRLTSTDNALAAPALNTIEWLSLAIYALYPSTDWKNDIPMFGAQMTGSNTGVIWANIAADPTITFGTQPVAPADYTYADDAVALTLIPSWLQPMLWTPLTMHQLRYDQMATGWAQAFAKWGSLIDDKLIYTLASTVPAASIIQTIGQKGLNGPGASFQLTGANDPNSFYYNPNLLANLATPAYGDITRIEQIYNRQNFNLPTERSRLVMDPTMEAFISLDPDTKSLLTRWIESNREDLLKIKHTTLNQRSRVAIYDPATGQVKDPSGVIPPTAVSAGISFLASQVAMGIGILDVFMIQDPAAYGYRMSADIREGIVPVRKNYNGTALYTYGQPLIA